MEGLGHVDSMASDAIKMPIFWLWLAYWLPFGLYRPDLVTISPDGGVLEVYHVGG